IARMEGPPGSARIEIPRWVQLVGLPLLLVLIWVVAGAVRHAVFLFLVALLIALLLNPLVRGLGRVWIPRGLGVAIVYLSFAAAVALAVIALATVVVQQTRHASHRVDNYFTVASGHPRESGAAPDLTRFPPAPGTTPLIERMEQALASYVKGQLALSLIIGVSAGFGIWMLGMVGLLHNGGKYALLFGVWVGITELIPYVGPWLGAAPPVLYALVQHPLSALWVALLFLGIQQLEGHVVVPKVMGYSLRLHPLRVIFGLLAGGEIYGFPGILVALPLLAAGRAAWEFFAE